MGKVCLEELQQQFIVGMNLHLNKQELLPLVCCAGWLLDAPERQQSLGAANRCHANVIPLSIGW